MNYSEASAAKAKALLRSEKRASKLFDTKAMDELTGKAGKPNKGKRKKSPSLSKLKKLLWTEISLYVREGRDDCQHCGSRENMANACHIVPSNDGAATRYFLPNIYRGCNACNEAERRRRGQWVYIHKDMFGEEFVDALYLMSKETFPLKKWWILEQIERIKLLRGNA